LRSEAIFCTVQAQRNSQWVHRATESSQLDLSPSRRSRFRRAPNQFTEDRWNSFEFRGLIEEEVRPGSDAFLPILGIREIRANQDMKEGMTLADRAQHVQTTASRHLKIENYRVRLRFPDGMDSLGNVAGSSYELNTGYLLEQIGKAFHDYPGVIGDKNSHPLSPREPSAHA
jgi:hypothetical protein